MSGVVFFIHNSEIAWNSTKVAEKRSDEEDHGVGDEILGRQENYLLRGAIECRSRQLRKLFLNGFGRHSDILFFAHAQKCIGISLTIIGMQVLWPDC